MASDSAAIETRHLAKAYRGPTLAVSDLTLRIERGSVFGFLGPNGAGKTSALKMLLGLVRPTSGDGSVLGLPLGDLRARGKIGYLPELFRYPEWLFAREVLEFHARLARVAPRCRRREISRVLSLVGLDGRAASRVGTYSKGMQQRLGLAVALLAAPEIVFLDEPTSALDPVGRRDVREIVRNLAQSETTVFINSHLLTEVEQVCDRVAILRSGQVVAAGSLSEVVGKRSGLRIRAICNNGSSLGTILQRFGDEVLTQPDGAIVRGVPPESVPDVVNALVAAGAYVHAVEPMAPSLEERFLEIMAQP